MSAFHPILVSLGTAIFAQIAWGQTNVYLQNNTSLSFTVHTTQSGTALRSDRWGAANSTIEAGQRRKIVWFNRAEGITNGRDFYFTSELGPSSGGPALQLKQRLRGTLLHSTMWQSLAGPGIDHPWYEDRNTHTAPWNVAGRSLTVKYRAYFTGGSDDIEYIVQEHYPVARGGPETLNLLSYNVYLRPTTMFANGQSVRAELIPATISGYDVLVLQEAFDDAVRAKLLQRLEPEYPHRTRILGRDRGVEQDGGVIIVSRWPIEAQDQRLFGEHCRGNDCLADKGVLYARINKESKIYHVFGTHLDTAAAPRTRQFRIIREFVDSKGIPAEEPVIIAGDMNVNMHAGEEYSRMLEALDAVHPPIRGHPFSSDGATNELVGHENRKLIDFVLYSRAHETPVEAHNEVRILRSQEEWKEFGFETAHWDLSDHYPVYGRFRFPPPAYDPEMAYSGPYRLVGVSSGCVVPLFSWWSQERTDNHASSDPSWAIDPRSITWAGHHVAGGPERNNYALYRLEGFLFDPRAPQPPNTVPLYNWWSHERADNFLSSDPRWSMDPASIAWQGHHITNGSEKDGYRLYRLEGYAFDPRRAQPPNTVPLYSWWSPERTDNFASSDPRWSMDPARITWDGHHVSNGPRQDGYTLYRLEGYLYRPELTVSSCIQLDRDRMRDIDLPIRGRDDLDG